VALLRPLCRANDVRGEAIKTGRTSQQANNRRSRCVPLKPHGSSSFHNHFALDHVHSAGESEFTLARRELDRDWLVERQLALDLVFFNHDLFGASLVSLSHEGHFGGHACFEFEAGRLEAF
jgi:hypothetical protein